MKPQDITFILVRPRYGGNIGSAARVLKNMGFSKLALVLPTVLPEHPEALRMAVGAADLLKKTKVYGSVEEASKGLNFLIGTSRRTGKYRKDFIDLPEIQNHLTQGQKVGILFGAEERGLTNKELAYCQMSLMIPSDPDFPSLNLAQAVAVVSYQFRLLFLEKKEVKQSEIDLAPVEDIEGMFQHLEKTLTKIGYLQEESGFHMMRSLRNLLGRTGLEERDVKILRGICRQMEWALEKKTPKK